MTRRIIRPDGLSVSSVNWANELLVLGIRKPNNEQFICFYSLSSFVTK